jgi:hypothetical protein
LHLYTCVHIFALYSPSYSLSLTPPSPISTNPAPPGRTCSAILYSNFVKEKRKQKTWHFSLFELKIATQGISLWYFHVYMYYNPNWLISTDFLHCTLVVSVGLRFLY